MPLALGLNWSSILVSRPLIYPLKMTHGPEFWLAYQFLSRGNIAPTTQLIELESPSYKLVDLEDVLEYGKLLFALFLLHRNDVDVQLLHLMMMMFTMML